MLYLIQWHLGVYLRKHQRQISGETTGGKIRNYDPCSGYKVAAGPVTRQAYCVTSLGFANMALASTDALVTSQNKLGFS